MRQAIKGRLTDSEEPVIIGVKGRGLVCIPKGSTLPNGRKQPISQALFRVEGGVALILNKHSKQEHVFAIVDWDEDQSGQKFITLKIPIEGFYRNQLN